MRLERCAARAQTAVGARIRVTGTPVCSSLGDLAINEQVTSIDIDKSVFRAQARVLKALANESRLLIVDRLSRGECRAGALTRLVGSDQTTVSKHLALLRAHG